MEAPRPRIAVVCSSYQRFLDWCRDEDLNPRDPSLCMVLREEQARGRAFDRIIGVGDYPLRVMATTRSRLRTEA